MKAMYSQRFLYAYYFECQSGSGLCKRDGNTHGSTEMKRGCGELKKGEIIKILLNCKLGNIHFGKNEKELGSIELKACKEGKKDVKYYPAIQLFGGYPRNEMKLFFD